MPCAGKTMPCAAMRCAGWNTRLLAARHVGLGAACEGFVVCIYFPILITGGARTRSSRIPRGTARLRKPGGTPSRRECHCKDTKTGRDPSRRECLAKCQPGGGTPSRRECLAKSESGGTPSWRESLVDLEAASRPRGRERLDGELLQADLGVTMSERWADRNRAAPRHVVRGVWSRQTVRCHVTS